MTFIHTNQACSIAFNFFTQFDHVHVHVFFCFSSNRRTARTHKHSISNIYTIYFYMICQCGGGCTLYTVHVLALYCDNEPIRI